MDRFTTTSMGMIQTCGFQEHKCRPVINFHYNEQSTSPLNKLSDRRTFIGRIFRAGQPETAHLWKVAFSYNRSEHFGRAILGKLSRHIFKSVHWYKVRGDIVCWIAIEFLAVRDVNENVFILSRARDVATYQCKDHAGGRGK